MVVLAYIIPVIVFFLGIRYKKSKYIMFIFVLYFFVLMGLNTYTPDYENYRLHFLYPETNTEVGFGLLCYIFNALHFTYQQFRMIIAVLYGIFAVLTAKRLSSSPNYILAFMLLWPFVAFVSGIRIALATIIVCYSVPFLLDQELKGTIKYVIGVLVASSIHVSCVFYLVLVLAKCRYKKRYYFAVFVGVMILSYLLRNNTISSWVMSITNNERLAKWLLYSASGSNLGSLNTMGLVSNIFFVVAFSVWIIILVNIMERSIYHNDFFKSRAAEDEYLKRMNVYRNIAICMLLTIPGYFISSEYQRFLFGILPVYYAVFAEFKMLPMNMSRGNKNIYKGISWILVILLAMLYIYSMQSHDVFATLKDNLLFQ